MGDAIDPMLWVKLLDYELEVRREAMNRMEDGTPLHKALDQAMKDPETKMKYFRFRCLDIRQTFAERTDRLDTQQTLRLPTP